DGEDACERADRRVALEAIGQLLRCASVELSTLRSAARTIRPHLGDLIRRLSDPTLRITGSRLITDMPRREPLPGPVPAAWRPTHPDPLRREERRPPCQSSRIAAHSSSAWMPTPETTHWRSWLHPTERSSTSNSSPQQLLGLSVPSPGSPVAPAPTSTPCGSSRASGPTAPRSPAPQPTLDTPWPRPP